MNVIDIIQNFPIIALSFIAVFGARAATVYPLLAATTRFARENTQYLEAHHIDGGNERCNISSSDCISVA
jgi:hypothetical protein